MLVVDDLQVREDLGFESDKVSSPAEQVACCSQFLRISIGGGEVASSQQEGQFLGVQFVIFHFATVDRFEVQRVSEDKGKISFTAGVGQPVPVEGRFAAYGNVAGERLDLLEEFIYVSVFKVSVKQFFTVLVDHTGVHLISVQINSAVEWVLSLIQIHRFSLG